MLEGYAQGEMNKNPSFDILEKDVFPYKRNKIMVIDDDQDFRLSVCELLVDEGFIVTTAKDGESAFNNLVHNQQNLPDLILIDLMMPVKSGLEFRREQLLTDDIAKIPVIFITGHGIVEGESCFLKPFDEREFIDAIRRTLS